MVERLSRSSTLKAYRYQRVVTHQPIHLKVAKWAGIGQLAFNLKSSEAAIRCSR